MKKVISLVIMMILVLFCLTGCSSYLSNEEYIEDDKLTGKIIGKYHINANNQLESMTINGEYQDVEVVRPEQWIIRIERRKGNSSDTEYTDVIISSEEWHDLQVGNKYSR